MTGEALWKVFLAANVPHHQLKSLGFDLFFARRAPSGDAVLAVNSIASRLGIDPRYAYAAFNTDPGRAVLEQLASDYTAAKPWPSTHMMTHSYITRVAERIAIVMGDGGKGSGGKGTPPLPPTPAPKAAATGRIASAIAIGAALALLALNFGQGQKRNTSATHQPT